MKETKFKQTLVQTKEGSRHCEEHSDVAIQGGFKMTEVGMIPSDWEVKSVGQLTNVLTGFPFPGNTILENGNVRLLRGVNITEGQIRHSDDIDRFYSGNIESLREYALREDDLVIGMDGSKVGKNSAIIHKNESGNLLVQRVARLRVKNSKQPISYIFYFISSNNFIAYIDSLKTNSAIPHISPADIRNYTIPLPSKIEEQQRIANALSDVDTLINNLEKLIAKKKNIKQGAMQQLLTGRKRLPGFTGKWSKKIISKIGFTYNGLSGKIASDFGKGSSLYVTFLNVLNNPVIDKRLFQKVNVSESENQNKVLRDDLLFNTSSEIPEEVGICSVLKIDVPNLYLNSFCFGFRLIDKTVDGLFLSYYFRSSLGRNLMSLLAQGSTRYNLSKDNFLKSSIVIPPSKTEQTAIANVLSDMDAEIATLETKLAKYRKLKTGMMQQLLTGKIRLV